MRNPKTVSYVFDPIQRTVDFSGTPNFDVRNLAGILHPSGALLYFPGKDAFGLDLSRTHGSVIALKTNTAAFTAYDPLIVLYEDGTAALPANASTADRQDQAKAVLQQILAAVQVQRTETIWTDDTGARFIRVDQGGTISWTDLSGAPSAAPGTGARPDSDSGTVVSHSTYRATASGTGFATNDILDHIVVTDGDAGDLVSNFWLNVTSGTKVAAPASASITPLAPLPDGAATAAKQDALATALASILAGIGTPADAAPATDGANGSLVGLIRRSLGYLSTLAGSVSGGLLSVLTPALDATGALAALNDAVSVNCSGRNTVVLSLPPGGWTGGMVVEGSAVGDFSDAVAISVLPYAGGPAVASLTAAGTYEATITGLKAVRVRATSAITGGPIQALIRAAVGNKSIRVGTPATNPLPVTTSVGIATTDAPYTIAAGANQQALPANATRQYLKISNTGASPMTVRFGAAATATQGHIIGAGLSDEFKGAVPSGALNIFSTNGTTAFVTAG